MHWIAVSLENKSPSEGWLAYPNNYCQLKATIITLMEKIIKKERNTKHLLLLKYFYLAGEISSIIQGKYCRLV